MGLQELFVQRERPAIRGAGICAPAGERFADGETEQARGEAVFPIRVDRRQRLGQRNGSPMVWNGIVHSAHIIEQVTESMMKDDELPPYLNVLGIRCAQLLADLQTSLEIRNRIGESADAMLRIRHSAEIDRHVGLG